MSKNRFHDFGKESKNAERRDFPTVAPLLSRKTCETTLVVREAPGYLNYSLLQYRVGGNYGVDGYHMIVEADCYWRKLVIQHLFAKGSDALSARFHTPLILRFQKFELKGIKSRFAGSLVNVRRSWLAVKESTEKAGFGV